MIAGLTPRKVVESSRVDACVVGIGRLGLAFALTLERSGLSVIGCDVNQDYIQSLNDKTYETSEPHVTESLKTCKNFYATTDIKAAARRADVVFILVATPTDGADQYYDHTTLSHVLFTLGKSIPKSTPIIINSTVYPGYIRNVATTLVANPISYNPAFVAQGDVMEGYKTGGWFGMVLIGEANPLIGHTLERIYRKISPDAKICRMTPESAEICKLASNCFRTMKIAFANAIGDIADATPGACKTEITEALKQDKSIGSICMTPGYAYGGPCYPRDNKAMAQYARQIGAHAGLFAATDESNEAHTDRMANELMQIHKKKYIFSDVAYKPKCAVPMIDHSAKLAIAARLARAGRRVVIKDRVPLVHEVMKKFGSLFEYILL